MKYQNTEDLSFLSLIESVLNTIANWRENSKKKAIYGIFSYFDELPKGAQSIRFDELPCTIGWIDF